MLNQAPAQAQSGYIYLLYGDDSFSIAEQVSQLKNKMLALPAGEFNLTILVGEACTVDALLAACDAVPFLSDRRMVVAEGLLGRLGGQGKPRSRRVKAQETPDAAAALERLLGRLETLPPTTSLVMAESAVSPQLEDRFKKGARYVIRKFERPRNERLIAWLHTRAARYAADLDSRAARTLAEETDDLRRLDSELAKLALYCATENGRCTIDVQAVRELVSGGQASIFSLLDAVAEHHAADALSTLRRLHQQGERPEAVIAQLAAQARRLLVARELQAAGRTAAEHAGTYGLNPNALPRLLRQTRGLTSERLERALRVLLDADRSLKTGRMAAELALELAVAEMAGS